MSRLPTVALRHGRQSLFAVGILGLVSIACTSSPKIEGAEPSPTAKANPGAEAEANKDPNANNNTNTNTNANTNKQPAVVTDKPASHDRIPVTPVSNNGETADIIPTAHTTPESEPAVVPAVVPPVVSDDEPLVAKPDSKQGNMLIPVTPFSNMESGYQATNLGFRAVLKDASGKVLAAGPMNMDAVVNGYSDDASQGSAYGRLVLNVALKFVSGSVQSGEVEGRHTGSLSICMADDTMSAYDASSCKSIGDRNTNRPYQWLDKSVGYEVSGDQIKITSFDGNTGEGGSRSQIALAVYHPAYGFAAPGKAFKDYQSPLVLDLSGDERIDLTDVWDESRPVRFDLSASGNSVRTGWVAAQDGLLALDVDGDGSIGSGRELFGEYSATGKKAEAGSKTFDNGFQALARHDSNHDGRIDAKDPVFASLLVWNDRNLDGISQKNELQSLAKAGVASISLAYERTGSYEKPVTVMDNEVRLKAQYTLTNGKHRTIADVWFEQRRGKDVAGK